MAAGLGFKTFTTGEVLTAADTNGYLMQGINVFASTAARDAAITSPQEGQFAYTKDTNSLWYYTGSAWAASGATGDIEGVTAGTGISGGGTSGTVTITNDMATTITAAGDIVVGTGSGTYDNLPIGTTAQVLTADTTVSPYKVKWATAAASSGPAFRAHTTAQQTIAATTFTKITFGGESFDTDGCFASNRFTPTKAGYYFFQWTLDLSGITTRSMEFWKNGADCGNIFFNASQAHTDMTNTNFIYMNGTTDYMEVYAYCNGSTTVENGTVDSYFSGFWVRS